MALYSFGAGKLLATPKEGEPIQFGTVQDVTIDVSFSDKDLRGENLFPVAIARTQGKVTIKAKFAVIDGKLFNNIFFGANAVTTETATEITLNNELMGASPDFSLSFENNYRGLKQVWEFPCVTANKLAFGYKNEDFTIPDLDMSAYADETGKVLSVKFQNS
ncbi:MAG: hypothetical protein FWG12_06290 [Holophagaceae bacterium]|nr:hypothetical protein [Holophagaceae bacterium]